MISISVTRANILNSVLELLRRRTTLRLEQGLYAASKVLLEKSKVLVPKDTTDLEYSGRVRVIEPLLMTVGYGGRDIGPQPNTSTKWPPTKNRPNHDVALYAISQHEHYEYNHTTGQAGYLKEPRDDDGVRQEMRQALEAAVKST